MLNRNLLLKFFMKFYSLLSSEPPRVSLNIGPTLSLQEGKEQKVICEAESYYPLDVQIVWYEQDPAVSGQTVAPLPKVLQNHGVRFMSYLASTIKHSHEQIILFHTRRY